MRYALNIGYVPLNHHVIMYVMLTQSSIVAQRFDTAKGFGFIVPDDGSNDVFVHQTAIKVEGFRSLAEGESVEFKIEQDANGKIKAVDVTGPDGSDVQGAPYNPNKGYDEW